jgi:calpain-15
MGKNIELPSGSIITKEDGEDYDEEWTMENKSSSTFEVTLDISKCTGVEIEGFEGEDEAIATCPPNESVTLFVIHKTPPFKFTFEISFNEIDAPIEEQFEEIVDMRTELEQKIDEMSGFMQSIPFDVMDHDDIIAKLEDCGLDHFLDPSFPPTDTSLYNTNKKYPYKKPVVWKRPSEFMKDPQLFCDDINTNDVKQGSIANCWFIAPIASVAENPALIRRLFITKEYNEHGLYRLRICKNGEWVKVTVDDYIPCFENGGPMFSRATGNELWVLLLEKAYAKLHGNYYQTKSGNVEHGMTDLTGCPSLTYKFPKERRDYNAIEDYAEDLWKKISYADSKGWIMCAGTPGKDRLSENGGSKKALGIVGGHAYSLIGCKEHNGIRLLNIRNPWGKFEWGGAWSDDSEEWTKEMIEVFKPSFDIKDGRFWISFEDFFKNYRKITICKVENWNEVRLRGVFMRLIEAKDTEEDFVLSKFYYSFRLEEKATIEIGLHQEDERVLGSDRRRYVDMQILILKRHTNGTLSIAHDSGHKIDRDIECSVTLSQGFYIVVPRSCGAALSRPDTGAKDPVKYLNEQSKRSVLHPVINATLDDIFRRIDVQLNGFLSVEELNAFGEIIDDDLFKNITSDDLAGKDFNHISCNADGLTSFGLKQMFREMDPKEGLGYLEKLGYDESLYSTKAKPFTITFHTNSDLRVRIGNALDTDLNEKAWDLMMFNYHKKKGASRAKKNDEVVVFRRLENKCFTFAAINKTDEEIEVNLNLTKSNGMLFQPSKGTVKTICPPKGLVYLASSYFHRNRDIAMYIIFKSNKT